MTLAACAPVSSGTGFLKSSLVYLDCAGRAIGATGYTTLTQPGSIIPQLILTAITLFIAWRGIRMMFGHLPDMGEAVLAVAKIGLVLMLVTSWPAVRTLLAEPSFAGPAELAAQTKIEGPLPLEDRLQRADDGIVTLTKWGTGKLDIRAVRTAEGQPAAAEFDGVALTDNLALGLGRLSFLVGAIVTLGLLRLLTGAMISALPIFAGLMLFQSTRGLFAGWLRLIFALFVASFAVPLILTVELSLLEPWLARAIEQRSNFFATPSAPTELLAIAGSFLLILTGSVALIVKSCFAVDLAGKAQRVERWRQAEPMFQPATGSSPMRQVTQESAPSRAEALVHSLNRIEHSQAKGVAAVGSATSGRRVANDASSAGAGGSGSRASRQRASQRMALSHAKRDKL
jgi:type IV secretion system protein VirB6